LTPRRGKDTKVQKQYYSSREDSDYYYFKKQSKLRLKILLAVMAVAVIVDVLLLILCGDVITTIISVGGSYLTVDKLIFFVVCLAATGVFTFLGVSNEEKRMSYIVWNCFVILIMIIGLFRSL